MLLNRWPQFPVCQIPTLFHRGFNFRPEVIQPFIFVNLHPGFLDFDWNGSNDFYLDWNNAENQERLKTITLTGWDEQISMVSFFFVLVHFSFYVFQCV